MSTARRYIMHDRYRAKIRGLAQRVKEETQAVGEFQAHLDEYKSQNKIPEIEDLIQQMDNYGKTDAVKIC